MVALAAQAICSCAFEQPFALLYREPIPNSYAQASDSFYAADPGSQFRTEQSRISCLIRNSTNCCESQVDRRRRVLPLFEADSVAEHHGPVECQAWLRAIPLDEFGYGVIVRALAASRGESVENRGFRLFKIWESEDALWRFLFPSGFRRWRRPP